MEVQDKILEKLDSVWSTLDFWRAETIRRLLITKSFAVECDGNARPPVVAYKDGTNSITWIWFSLWLDDLRGFLNRVGYGQAIRTRLDQWIVYEPVFFGQVGSEHMKKQLENAKVASEEGRSWVMTPEREGRFDVFGTELRAEIDRIVEELIDGRIK